MSLSSPLHVVPDRLGAWHIQREGEDRPLSIHRTTTDAEREAIRCARATGAVEVVIHDRYGRTHRAPRLEP